MPRRIERVNEVIKEEISGIILKEVEFFPDVLVTITRVETAQDLRDSNVFVSAFPEDKMPEAVGLLNKKVGFLQRRLNDKLKMKPFPKIRFIAEKETAGAARIEEILERLKKEEK